MRGPRVAQLDLATKVVTTFLGAIAALGRQGGRICKHRGPNIALTFGLEAHASELGDVVNLGFACGLSARRVVEMQRDAAPVASETAGPTDDDAREVLLRQGWSLLSALLAQKDPA